MDSILDLPPVMYAAACLCAFGLAIATWELLVAGRAHGRRRCPRCWYSMEGAAADSAGAYQCPECGRAIRSERGLLRTRRHWRGVLCGMALVLSGVGVGGWVVLRDKNPWRFAPDLLLIHELPNMPTYGPTSQEFRRRQFVQGFTGSFSITSGGPDPRFKLDKCALKPLFAFERRLLARRAIESLEASPIHPLTDELLIILALTGQEKERTYRVATSALTSQWPSNTYVAGALVVQLAPDHQTAAKDLASALDQMLKTDPQLTSINNRFSAVVIIDALGRLGTDAAAAVPTLTRLLPFARSPGDSAWLPVDEALRRIQATPGASTSSGEERPTAK